MPGRAPRSLPCVLLPSWEPGLEPAHKSVLNVQPNPGLIPSGSPGLQEEFVALISLPFLQPWGGSQGGSQQEQPSQAMLTHQLSALHWTTLISPSSGVPHTKSFDSFFAKMCCAVDVKGALKLQLGHNIILLSFFPSYQKLASLKPHLSHSSVLLGCSI